MREGAENTALHRQTEPAAAAVRVVLTFKRAAAGGTHLFLSKQSVTPLKGEFVPLTPLRMTAHSVTAKSSERSFASR